MRKETKKEQTMEKASRYLLKALQKEGADDVVINAVDYENNQIKFVNNSVVETTTWNSKAINIFMNCKKKIISSTIRAFNEKALEKSAKILVKNAMLSGENSDFNGIAKGPFKYKKPLETYDKQIENLGERGTEIVEDAISVALREGAARICGNFEYGTSKNYLLTSNNVEVSDKGTSAYMSVRAFTDKDSSGQKTACSRILKKLDYRYAARKAAVFSVMGRNPEDTKAGKYDVFFDPMAFSVILHNIASAYSVFSVEAGLSFFAGKLNKKVANKKVTIYDDGGLANGYGSETFDDEGTPTGKTTIIKEGILKNCVHNFSTGKKYGVKSTGNAGLMSPEPTNTILAKGKESKDKIFDGINKGFYITNLWYTRYQNHATGDFSTVPRDSIFYIENGRIKKAVKGTRISDNMINVLNNIQNVSNESEQVFGWETESPVVTPFVHVKNINITRSV